MQQRGAEDIRWERGILILLAAKSCRYTSQWRTSNRPAPDIGIAELRNSDTVRILQFRLQVLNYTGCSFCRFVCGTADDEMGSSDFYDGEWQWPEGLAHYVEYHSVRLPEEFIDTMRSRSWQLPSDRQPPGCREQLDLRAVGFWRSKYDPTLPDPRALVQPGWYGFELPRILAYLRGGRSHISDVLDWIEADEEELMWSEEYSPSPRVDQLFWQNWAQSQGAIPLLCAPAKDPMVRREWLVRPGTLEESLCFEEVLFGRRLRDEYGDLLRSQVNAALEPGRKLWLWQNGDPRRERGASAGLAVLQDSQVLCEWWLHPGWLAEHRELDWIRGDGQVRLVNIGS